MNRLQSTIAIFIAFACLFPFLVQGKEESISPESISVERKLLPVDEANQNPDFKAFRDSLLAAIERKDLGFLLDHVDDEIGVSFGADHGKKDFIRFWKLDENPGESRIWAKLKEVLRLGGTFRDEEKTSFTAPYIFTRFPRDFDPFQGYSAITDSVVYLRAEPDSSSAVLNALRYSIVKMISEPWMGEDSWRKIETLSGIKGYVEGRNVRNLLDLRANFTRKSGKWKMTFFIAGD